MIMDHIYLKTIDECSSSLKLAFPAWDKWLIDNNVHLIATHNHTHIKKFWNIDIPFQNCVFCYDAKGVKIPLFLKKNGRGLYFFETFYSNDAVINDAFFKLIPEEDKFILFSGESASPIVYKDCDTFEQYMRKHRKSYVAILFGAKSKKVKWDYCDIYSPEYKKVLKQVGALWSEHCAYIMQKSPNFEVNWETCEQCWTIEDHSFGVVYATDVELNKIICVMQIGDICGEGSCGVIALTHDEKYKPYGLVSSAQYWAINYFFYQNANYQKIDLGWNGDSLGNYKKDLADEFTDLYTLNDVKPEELDEFMKPFIQQYEEIEEEDNV